MNESDKGYYSEGLLAVVDIIGGPIVPQAAALASLRAHQYNCQQDSTLRALTASVYGDLSPEVSPLVYLWLCGRFCLLQVT